MVGSPSCHYDKSEKKIRIQIGQRNGISGVLYLVDDLRSKNSFTT